MATPLDIPKLDDPREPIWSDAERSAWAPADPLSPSQWAATHRILPDHVAEPGPWRNQRTPYLVGIMDAFADPDIEEIIFLKPTQVGFSESIRNILGWVIDQQPGPVLLVMPNESDCVEVLDEEVKPLLNQTPRLEQYMTSRVWDIKSRQIKLANMTIYTAWSTSAAKLARRPIRYVLLDEIDKFPAQAGKEASPLALAAERTRTYGHRRKIVKGSTPTTPQGHIWREWESCTERRRFAVPCPHCRHYQLLIFSNLRWPPPKVPGAVGERFDATDDLAPSPSHQPAAIEPLPAPADSSDSSHSTEAEARRAHADQIQTDRSAWYECEHCRGRILDHHKGPMLLAGRWINERQRVDREGNVIGERYPGRKVGFALSALYSPWVSFWELAREFILARGDPVAMQHFRNSKLAEPFQQQVARVRIDRAAPPSGFAAGQVPQWAHGLTMGVDSQKAGFWWLVRAWGAGLRSHLVAYGFARSLAEIDQLARQAWLVQGTQSCLFVRLAAIDAGGGTKIEEEAAAPGSAVSRTDEVYRFCLGRPDLFVPVKGNAKPQPVVVMPRRIHYTPPGQASNPYMVHLHLLDTGWLKDHVASYLGRADLWSFFDGVGQDYQRQIISEHKVIAAGGRMSWQPVSAGAANHLWDCEVYAMAAGEMLGVRAIPDDAKPCHVPINPPVPPPVRERPKTPWVASWKGRY